MLVFCCRCGEIPFSRLQYIWCLVGEEFIVVFCCCCDEIQFTVHMVFGRSVVWRAFKPAWSR